VAAGVTPHDSSICLAWWCGLLREHTHVTVQPFALFTEPHRGIDLKKLLVDVPLARYASAKRTLFETLQGSAQFIDSRIALERKECIDFPERELTANE